ncbi:VanZ family protein [Acetobacterium sp.]|uniref:VanZ family protein n=1 Tax=Acetobacterium sp. TaxID=1872094 RepID=UPI003593E414
MDKKRLIQLLTWSCALLWMGIIFYLSSQPATQSEQLSTGLKDGLLAILRYLMPGIESIELGNLDFLIRKNAHFMAYFILGVLTLLALVQSEARKPANLALLICMIYAMTDEFHQLFVLGRSGQFRDVLIDAAGAVLGILLTSLVINRISRRF